MTPLGWWWAVGIGVSTVLLRPRPLPPARRVVGSRERVGPRPSGSSRSSRPSRPSMGARLRRAAVGGRRRHRRRVGERDLEALADIVDLLRITAAGGLTPAAAVVAVDRQLGARAGPVLGPLAADLARGRPLAEALGSWSDTGPAAELAELLGTADRTGASLVDPLGRLAADLRRRRRRSAELRARRLPVTLLVPLVLCILPAFGLLTVVPVLAVGLDRFAEAAP